MSTNDDDPRRAKGIEIIRKLGIRGGAPLPDGLATITVEHLFGDVWHRPDLELRERSLVTVSALIAMRCENEQRIHLRGALELGIPKEKLEEVITHLAHYAGWPAAVGASRVLAEVVAEREAEAAGVE